MSTIKSPTFKQAIIPVLSLIIMLFFSVKFFGDNSSSGPNQIVLTLGAAITSIIGIRLGFSWIELQRAMVNGISTAMPAILILLVVGALIGTWLMAGTVPSLIYYGLCYAFKF